MYEENQVGNNLARNGVKEKWGNCFEELALYTFAVADTFHQLVELILHLDSVSSSVKSGLSPISFSVPKYF
jgi:hypothetical protein